MTVPARFVGAWQRQCLEVDGHAVAGIGPAVWIEAGGTYVDVRALGTLASNTGFGGRSTWRAPRFTWHHDVDLDPQPGAVDRATLVPDHDDLIEHGFGLTGAGVPYVEHWHRLPTTTRVTSVVVHDRGLAVRVGDHAGAVLTTPRRACCWTRTGDRWRAVISLGGRAELPDPRDDDWWLPRGWQPR